MNKAIKMLCLSLTAVGLFACAEKPEEEVLRDEYISVYETSPDVLVSEVQIPFEGVVDAQLHVLSNLELDWRYQVDQTMVDPNWLTIKSVEEIEKGHYLVKYDAKSLLDRNTISRRESTLSFFNAKNFMGKYITFRQGYTEEYAQDFSSLPDGYVELTGKQTYTTETLHIINKDYYNYVIIDKDGTKYVTGSPSFWSSFKEIWDEMREESDEEFSISIYKVPSKNYNGKDFITCSII